MLSDSEIKTLIEKESENLDWFRTDADEDQQEQLLCGYMNAARQLYEKCVGPVAERE